MALRILITNDDGIGAPGLRALVDWASGIGEVEVFAPLVEQSGKSVSLELHKPFSVKRVEYEGAREAYAVDSTPADCVRFARLGFDKEYDLVLSGINNGKNLGYDINYSGTVGAVIEASMLGMKGIAVSTSPNGLASAVASLDRVRDFILERELLASCNVLNVNIPKEPGDIVITRQGGKRFAERYIDLGNGMYTPEGYESTEFKDDMTVDTDALRMGYISISPLTCDRTDRSAYERLLR